MASSLWSLPFPDRAFDAVIAVLLAHVERFEPLLQEMARVSNGRVIVDFPPVFSANLVQPLLFGMKRQLEGNTRPYFSYHARQLYPPLRAAGFGRFRGEAVHRAHGHPPQGRPPFSEVVETACRWSGLTRLFGSPSVLLAERLGGMPSAGR